MAEEGAGLRQTARVITCSRATVRKALAKAPDSEPSLSALAVQSLKVSWNRTVSGTVNTTPRQVWGELMHGNVRL